MTEAEAAALVAEFATDRVHAVAVVGSYARGDADAFSDIDLKCFVSPGPKPPDWFGYRFGRFLNVFSGPVEERLAALRDPGEAIWAVPMFREMRVLLDREGRARALRETALAFSWDPLHARADRHVSLTLAYHSEYVLKVLGGLATGAADRTVSATWEVLGALTRAMAVHRRLLIPSDRTYFRVVRAAAGDDTRWARLHRLAAGTDEEPAAGRAPWETRGAAAVQLYLETAALVRAVLEPRHRAAVDGAVQRIGASAWGPRGDPVPPTRVAAPAQSEAMTSGPPPRLVLLCGLPGAGKTTLARQLAAALPALRLCPDEWMTALGIDLADESFRDRLEALFWAHTQRVLALGQSVILESGFWSRADRDEKRAGARALGARVELRYLDVPLDELWTRLQRRNAEPGSTGTITREQLEQWAGYFAAPDAAELAQFDPPQHGPGT